MKNECEMKRIVIELPNMRAYVKYDDPKILGSVELEMASNDNAYVFNNIILKHLKNHDASIEKAEALDNDKNVINVLTREQVMDGVTKEKMDEFFELAFQGKSMEDLVKMSGIGKMKTVDVLEEISKREYTNGGEKNKSTNR